MKKYYFTVLSFPFSFQITILGLCLARKKSAINHSQNKILNAVKGKWSFSMLIPKAWSRSNCHLTSKMNCVTQRALLEFLSNLKSTAASWDSPSDRSIPNGQTSWEPKWSWRGSPVPCITAPSLVSHRHQLSGCMRAWFATEEMTRDTNWQLQSSHRRKNSTRSQRTPKVQHRDQCS